MHACPIFHVLTSVTSQKRRGKEEWRRQRGEERGKRRGEEWRKEREAKRGEERGNGGRKGEEREGKRKRKD